MDAILLIATVSVNLLLGFIILSRDSKQLHARLFCGMSIVICLWITANYFTNHYFGSVQMVDLSNRLAFFFGYGVVASGLSFTYFFPVVRKVSKIELSVLLGVVVVTFAFSLTRLVAGHTQVIGDTVHFSAGPLVIMYLLSFVAVIAMIARNLIRFPEGVTLKTRQQAKIVLFAFVFSALAGVTLNLGLPLAGATWEVTRLGPASTVVLVALTAYAIVRHGLFDIKTAVIRTTGYVLTLATLSMVYFLLAYLASITIFKDNLSTGFSMSPINMGLALVLAFIFQPIKQFFDKTTDRIFYKDRYNADEFFARLSGELTTTTELRSLLQRAAGEIGATLKAEQAFFYVRYNHIHKVSAGTPGHASLSDEDAKTLMHYDHDSIEGLIVTDLVEDAEVKRILQKYHIALTMPLRHHDGTIGMFILGEQRSSHYTNRDFRVLHTIADELIIAIQNSLSVQEIRDINIHLQQRIDEATKELRHSNSKLKELDKSKDEFISMASHQLRTPLTAVKGYVSMLLEGDIGKVTPQQREVLEQAYDSSQRMVFLIGDFLNVSRLQTGKFVLEPSSINFTKLVEEEVDQLKDTARARHITLNYHPPSTVIVATADENKLRQVMMNFMDNAIFYSPTGKSIDVQLYKDADNIVFRVVDHGIGVPKAEQAKLFTKFFRAGNARQQRPDGTGIGIYMAKKVVLAHGGSLIFESKEGVGSTFGFKLPLKNDLQQLDKQPDASTNNAGHDSAQAN